MTIEIPDEGELATIASRIDVAANGVVRDIDVQGRLRADETPIYAAVAAAFYYFERSGDESARDDYFKPMVQFENSTNPPPVREMPEWVRQLWEECANRVGAPVARARLHDLCFEAQQGNRRVHARSAIEAYMELAELYPSVSEEKLEYLEVALGAGKSLSRALDLARRTRQGELADQVLRLLVKLADKSLDDERSGPGIVMRFLTPIVEDRDGAIEVEELLRRARARYQGDVWNTLSTIGLQLQLRNLTDEARRILRREAIQALFDASERENPMNAMTHLQDAADRAKRYGLHDLFEEATRRLQDFAGKDIGLVKFESKFEIPVEAIEAEIGFIVGTTNWKDAMLRLFAVGAPSGKVDFNRAASQELLDASPLMAMSGVEILGNDGLPRFTATTDEERESYHLAQIELREMQLTGYVRSQALSRIVERYGPVSEAELSSFIRQHGHVPEPVAMALSRAFGRFFAGDYEGATFTAVPRVERLAREILLRMRVSIFQPSFGGRPGQFSGLGVLLDLLGDRGFDESWLRFFRTFLTRPEGLNYRNELSHGTVDNASMIEAVLTLIACLYLAVGIQLTEQGDNNQSTEARSRD